MNKPKDDLVPADSGATAAATANVKRRTRRVAVAESSEVAAVSSDLSAGNLDINRSDTNPTGSEAPVTSEVKKPRKRRTPAPEALAQSEPHSEQVPLGGIQAQGQEERRIEEQGRGRGEGADMPPDERPVGSAETGLDEKRVGAGYKEQLEGRDEALERPKFDPSRSPRRGPRGRRPRRDRDRSADASIEASSQDAHQRDAHRDPGYAKSDPEVRVSQGQPQVPEAEALPFRSEVASISPVPGAKHAVDPDFGSLKLQKVLADAGIGSRRDMEELILAGRVSVNGMPAHIGQRIGPSDQVRINGRMLQRKFAELPPRVLLYHKPSGEICSRDDPGHRPTVFGRLPRLKGARWVAVGRLDFNTEGLLIFTTSGDIANRLMHPRYGWEREYAVRILGRIDEATAKQLLEGVNLEDGSARFNSLEDVGGDGANHWYRVTLSEGRNREIRRIFEAVGLVVSRLARIRFGPVGLPEGLVRARYVELSEQEVRRLQQLMREADPHRPNKQAPNRPADDFHVSDHDHDDEEHDDEDDEGPPPGFDPSAYLPRYADEPVDRPELQDDEWQPRNANAHLEGITRSVRKSVRAPSALAPGLRPPGQGAGGGAGAKNKRRGGKNVAKFNLTPGIYQPGFDGQAQAAYPAGRPKSAKRRGPPGGQGGGAGSGMGNQTGGANHPGGARGGAKPQRSRRKSLKTTSKAN